MAQLADHHDPETGAMIQEGRVGDKLFIFLEDEPTTGEYKVIELGSIVSLQRSTDSLVFEVNDNIHVESFVLHPILGLQTRISLGRFSMEAAGATLVGYGAQRQGTIGRLEGTDDDSGDLSIGPVDPE